MKQGRCCWVEKTWGTKPDGSVDYLDPPIICNKPTRYRMVKDDDGRRVRKYNTFCAEHQAAADAAGEEDDL